jgi:hypothetical protein
MIAKKQFYLIRRKDKLMKGRSTFYCRFRNSDGTLLPWQSTGETAKTRAENWAFAEMERRKNEAPSDRVTLESFAKGFFLDSSPCIERQHRKGRKFGNAHAKNRQGHLDRYLLPRFGKMALTEISKPDIEDWLVGLGLSNATCNHIIYTLRIVLREAKDRKNNILGLASKKVIISEVEHLFSTFGRNGGYVMSASDHFFHAPRENLLHYARAARSCTY